MKLKQNFKETEIGILPEDWEVKELGSVVDFRTGKLDSNQAEENGEYPFFTCAPEPMKINTCAFDCTAILLAGNNADGIFHMNYHSGKFNAYQRTYVITTSKQNQTALKYIYYQLNLRLNYLREVSQGTATRFLTMRILNSLKIAYPRFREQEEIAKILSDLDNKIQLNRQINKKLEAIGQALFKQWFVDFEFPNEKGKPYKSSSGKMVNSELGEIPKGWKVLKMEAVVAEKKFSIVDGPFGTQLHSEEYVEEGIPVIRVANLSFEGKFGRDPIVYITEEKFKSLIRSAIYPGDILLAKTGATIGKLARCPSFVEKGLVASSVMKISPHPEKFNKHFLYNIIRILSEQKYWESISGGSTRPTINIPDVKSLGIIYPSDDLMKKYHTLVDPLYSKMEIDDQDIFCLSRIRDSLLPRLMSGKIRVGMAK